MKKNIGNCNELLKTLVQNGDPSAFFSLTGPYFQVRYQKERSDGLTDPDATNKVLAEAAELLEHFQDIPAKQVDRWFEEHCTVSISSQHDQEEVVTDKKMVMETNRFLNECSQKIIKTGSLLNKKKQEQKKKFPDFILRNRFFLPIGIPVLVLITCSGTLLLMSRLHLSFSVTFSTLNNQYSLQIPLRRVMNESIPQSDTVLQKIDTTVILAPDTVSKSTDIAPSIEKTIPHKPVVQKKNIPIPVSTPIVEKRLLPPVVPRPQNRYTPPPQPVPAATVTYPTTSTTLPAQPVTAEVPSVVSEPPAENTLPAASPSTGTASESGNSGF